MTRVETCVLLSEANFASPKSATCMQQSLLIKSKYTCFHGLNILASVIKSIENIVEDLMVTAGTFNLQKASLLP